MRSRDTSTSSTRFNELQRRLKIVRADNDILLDETGKSYIDLFSAHGATWVGHCNPRVVAAVTQQLNRIWLSGGLETDVHCEAKSALERILPASHQIAVSYSTGMEAAEFALRFARCTTNRNGVVGFSRSMHGKSMATAFLGWDNGDNIEIPGFHRLPFVGERPEEEILRQVEEVLATEQISAVFIEPLQGCGGGHMASPRFCREVRRLCTSNDALLIFDEILTGFYRTGPSFFFCGVDCLPDVVLLGKAMGNGFPVSAVAIDLQYVVEPHMLPGSTFSSNPLASAAVSCTLQEMDRLDVPNRVKKIEQIILANLQPLRDHGVFLRGRGAFWVLELPAHVPIEELIMRLFRRGVCAGFTDRQIRVLPAATIRDDNLQSACRILSEEIMALLHDGK